MCSQVSRLCIILHERLPVLDQTVAIALSSASRLLG